MAQKVQSIRKRDPQNEHEPGVRVDMVEEVPRG